MRPSRAFRLRLTQYASKAPSFFFESELSFDSFEFARFVVFVGPARQAGGIGVTRTLGDPVTDVIDRVVAGHILFLQEICRVRLALGEDRDQHVGAGHFLAARRLDVERSPLHHALEAVRRLGLLLAVDDQVLELGIEIVDDGLAQPVEIDPAGAQHRRRIDVVDQRQQQMF